MNKQRVLVTAIGTVTATAIVRQLKTSGRYFIIGADINPQSEIATSLDVDMFCQFPYSDTQEYIPFVLDFCEQNNVEYYFAVLDKEVVSISKNANQFARIGTKLCVANYDFAQACHFKNEFGKWIEAHYPSVAIRHYYDFESLESAEFPLFLKPNEGVASAGCEVIGSLDELREKVDAESIGGSFVVQDYIQGENVTVDCVRNRKTGQTRFAQRIELLRNSNGCGIAVKTFEDPALESICEDLVNTLDLNGIANIELFKTSKGYKVIEINPRFSAGTTFTCMAGLDTVRNAILIAEGLPCEFSEFSVGACFAERYEAYRLA